MSVLRIMANFEFGTLGRRGNSLALLCVGFERKARAGWPRPLEAQGMPHVENDHIVETKTEARAGVTGQGVRGVLLWGTVGVVVLFVIVFLVFFA